MVHQSVLLHESIEGLNLKSGDIFVDCTLNGGGHSKLVYDTFGTKVHIIGIDLDADAIERAHKTLKGAHVTFNQENFRNLDTVLEAANIPQANAFLFDLGLSSNQIDDSGRGFSFKRSEPLRMTMKKDPQADDVTAYEVVNHWGEDTLTEIIRGYGEERFAARIAKAIVHARELAPIETTDELARVVTEATPLWYRFKKIHPATRTFQAIRIAVNDELQAIKEALPKAFERLAPHGRMSVISFHSLEDRIVKRFYKQLEVEGKATLVTKKPLIPSDDETAQNPRSRSAKLRILEKN